MCIDLHESSSSTTPYELESCFSSMFELRCSITLHSLFFFIVVFVSHVLSKLLEKQFALRGSAFLKQCQHHKTEGNLKVLNKFVSHEFFQMKNWESIVCRFLLQMSFWGHVPVVVGSSNLFFPQDFCETLGHCLQLLHHQMCRFFYAV